MSIDAEIGGERVYAIGIICRTCGRANLFANDVSKNVTHEVDSIDISIDMADDNVISIFQPWRWAEDF